MTGPRSAAVAAPQTSCGRSVMVSIGDPFAVLNRDGLITHPYLRQCDAYLRPGFPSRLGSRKNKQNNRKACPGQGGGDNYLPAATSAGGRRDRALPAFRVEHARA